MEKHPMTPEGYDRLKEELGRLKSEERPSVIREIGTAREHGDLSENAEYHAAKDRQGLIEARISELESKIGLAEVIDISNLSGERIQFGAKVTVVDEETDEETGEETGEEIGLKRLEARPVATYTLEAQERREITEKQFKDTR